MEVEVQKLVVDIYIYIYIYKYNVCMYHCLIEENCMKTLRMHCRVFILEA